MQLRSHIAVRGSGSPRGFWAWDEHAYRPHEATDAKLLSLAEEMGSRTQAQILVAGFEFTEKFLRTIASATLFLCRNAAGRARISLPFDKGNFHRRQEKWSQKDFRHLVGTPEYYEAFADMQYGVSVTRLFGELGYALPVVKESDRYRSYLELS